MFFVYCISKVKWINVNLIAFWSLVFFFLLCIYSEVFLLMQPECRIAEVMISSNPKLCIIKLAQRFDTSSLGKTHELQRMLLMALWAVIFPLRKMLDKLLTILWRCDKGSLSKNTGDSVFFCFDRLLTFLSLSNSEWLAMRFLLLNF